ncbi:TetR/AcrR family transcriptional regulator C-terminal domain-containing protein [Streptomyces sp. CA-250714]|uniref:TetR/AcrR family transcriptional regulator C-terminal domain-containing protein n=1 Tax=Streptomyces sp. CA-250714 TaxID=3240060 RepID=UPI003D8C9E38
MAFASRVATETFPSPDYVTFRQLTAQGRSAPRLPETARERPERMLEERFAKLVADGEIRAADPHRAVQHFTALTMLLALDALKAGPAGAVGE